jgi:hypothetical protein
MRNDEQRKRISEGRKGKALGARNPMKNAEVRAKISGPNCHLWGKTRLHNRGGRVPVKTIVHISPIAGEIKVLGTFEKRMCRLLDRLGWEWCYEPDSFPYTKLDRTTSNYTPDFRVKWNGEDTIYIETKGWFPVEDQHKVNEIRKLGETVLVIGRKELKRLEDSLME